MVKHIIPANRIERCSIVSIFLFVVLFWGRAEAVHADMASTQTQDSLLNALSKATRPGEKINILEFLAILNEQKAEELTYRKQVIEIANEADTLESSYQSMTLIARYYAIKKDIDSLWVWVNKLDSVRLKDPRALAYQFRGYNYLCRVYMAGGELEKAMNIAISQRLLADKTGDVSGQILSSENLGLIYLLTKRYKDAISMFETCLSYLDKEEQNLDLKLQVAESLIRTYIYQSEFAEAERLLLYYDKTLRQIEADTSGDYLNYNVRYSRCFSYTYRIWMYSLQNEPVKALEMIKALEPYKDALSGFGEALNRFAMGNYYFSVKEYDKALSVLLPIEEGDEEVLRLKIQILKGKGDKKRVLDACIQLLDVYKEKNMVAYLKQVDQLRSLQSLNEEEKQSQLLLSQKQELRNKHMQLVLILVFSLILVIALIFLFRYSFNIRRLKNALLKDRAVLKDINRNLEIAKENAEKADRMKTNFVANLSHEIHTPLNLIVGYTRLLSDSKGEERVGYIKAISENSDFLLNLVSEVLDLSHLDEARFTLSPPPITPVRDCSGDAASQLSSIVSEK